MLGNLSYCASDTDTPSEFRPAVVSIPSITTGLVNLLSKHADDAEVAEGALSVLGRLTAQADPDDAFANAFLSAGGYSLLAQAFYKNVSKGAVVGGCVRVIRNISCTTAGLHESFLEKCLPVLVTTLSRYAGHPTKMTVCCDALANIASKGEKGWQPLSRRMASHRLCGC